MGLRSTIEGAVKRLMRRHGMDIKHFKPASDPMLRLVHALDRRAVSTLLDVGAHVGEFVTALREAGWRGRIISYEPIASCHERLSARAARDPAWTVAPRCAVGAASGTVEINVSGNEVSSSILPMLERHRTAAPDSGTVRRESVPLVSLDREIAARFPDGAALALKIDVQGYEAAVIDGAAASLPHLRVIYLEMQLERLYDGSVMFDEMYRRLAGSGYRCIGISEGFTDAERFEVLQVDGLFVRDAPR
jgi:FkbM family methyltransferase